MKDFNNKHDVIITSNLVANIRGEEPKTGEIVPHSKKVQNCTFYQSHYINDGEMFVKVFLSKDMILDLAEQIRELEKETVNAEYCNLPF